MPDNYEQFRNRYRDMADEELLGLAEQSDDLVEQAHAALWDEVESRGLQEEAEERNSPPAPAPANLQETSLLADYRRGRSSGAPVESVGLALVHTTGSVETAAEIQRHLTDHGVGSQLQVMILVPHEEATKAFAALEKLPGLKEEGDLTGAAEDETEEEEDK